MNEYIADQDRQWMRDTIAQARAAAPHHATVVWAPAERGVPQFSVQCQVCGQVSIGVDKTWLTMQAREHEQRGGAK